MNEEIAEPTIKLNMIFGRVELRSWSKWDNARNAFIGMGSKTVFDKDGNFESYEESPTGIVMRFSEPDERKPWWRFW